MSQDLAQMRLALLAKRRDRGASWLYAALAVLDKDNLIVELDLKQHANVASDLECLRRAGLSDVAAVLEKAGVVRKGFWTPSEDELAGYWLCGAAAAATLLPHIRGTPSIQRIAPSGRTTVSVASASRDPSVEPRPRDDQRLAAVILVLPVAGDDLEAPVLEPDAHTVAGWASRATKWKVVPKDGVDEVLRKLDVALTKEDTGLLLVVVATGLRLRDLGPISFQGTLAERLGETSTPIAIDFHSLRSTRGMDRVFARGG